MHEPTSQTTLIDLNRAGAALVEIVSEPDMTSAEEAAAYVRKVQSLLRCVGSSNADMEKVGTSTAFEFNGQLCLSDAWSRDVICRALCV